MKNSLLLLAMCQPRIKNIEIPSCNKCIHYQPTSLSNDGYCKLFGEKNIISNDIRYEWASRCRENENKCGLQAKHYKELSNPFILLRNYNRNFMLNTLSFFTGTLIGLSIVFSYYINYHK